MKIELLITLNIEINANKDKVWDILINPDKIRTYLFGTTVSSDWRSGSDIIFQGEYQGCSYQDKGKILEVKKEELLEYTYWSSLSGLEDKLQNYSLIIYELEKEKEKTKFTLTQIGFVNKEAQQHSYTNWKTILDRVKQIAES